MPLLCPFAKEEIEGQRWRVMSLTSDGQQAAGPDVERARLAPASLDVAQPPALQGRCLCLVTALTLEPDQGQGPH